MPAVLILGASSAIARATAKKFAAHGNDLILAGRQREELEADAADLTLRYKIAARILVFDALDFESHEPVLSRLLRESGDSLDGVVICIGYLGDQVKAQGDAAEARRILDTNLTGCISALEILAGYFEKRRRGFICALSSVAGDRGRQSNYLYGAAKAGLSAYLQGLRNRLYHSHVHVLTVKPGFVDTRMTFGHPKLFLVASPESAARSIYRAIVRRKNVVYVPWFWRWVMLLVRAAPERIFKRLKL